MATIRVPAYDRESSSLTYSLATAADMGYPTETQPNQLSVNSTTGLVTFNTNNIALGYYSTQIKISDGLCYVVVDFMIFVVIRPILVPCLANPLDGQTLNLYANVAFSAQIQTTASTGSQLPLLTRTIVPSSLSLSSTQNGVFNLSWNPSLSDIGSYVVSLGCRLSSLSLGLLQCAAGCQSSFVINVVPPPCGSGSLVNPLCNPTTSVCACTCPTGFALASNCTQCLPGYYGPSCTQCQCVYGTCADGITNTGQCSCFSGYKGVKCDTLVKPCNFSLPGYIRQISNTSSSLVSPSLSTVFVSGAPTVVGLVASIPLVAPKIDVMLLVDTSATISLSTLLNLQGIFAVNFVSSVGGFSPSVYFALSTFSNPTNCLLSLSTSLRLSLTASSSDFISALGLYLTPTVQVGCTVRPQGAQLGALVSASASAAGWRSDSFKVIVVITDSVFGEGGQYYSDRAAVKNALLGINAAPLFITPTTVQSVYSALVADLGFGSVGTMNPSWSNSYTAASNTIRAALSYVWTVTQDAQNFTQAVTPPFIVNPPTLARVNVTLLSRTVNSTVASLSDITVNVVGWGIATITPQVNQAPVAAVVSVTTREDIAVNVPLSGSDADGDSLNVIVDVLPARGTLYTNSSATAVVVANTFYPLPDGTAIPYFYYVPNLHYYGTDTLRFYLHDGCTRSASANASLTITFYNYPPTAATATTFTNENTNATIQFTVSDVEDPMSSLVSVIRSLPDPNLATIYHINNGSAIQIGDLLASSVNHTVRYVPKTYACCDTSSFNYQVRDTGNQSSPVATISTFIVHVNQPPVATAVPSIFVNRGVSSTVTLSSFDPDNPDWSTFTVSAVGTGSFSASNGSVISTSTVPFAFTAVPVSNTIASVTVNFTSPSNSASGSTLRYFVTDAAGNVSAPMTVTININPNQAPVARPVGTVSFPFNSASSVFYLYGTDPDAADTPATLQIVVLSLPSRGSLAVNGVTLALGDIPYTVANNASCIVTGTSVAGTDQFSFLVVDILGATSVSLSVNLRYVQVNRPPSASIGTIVTPEDVEVVGRVNANDPDGDTLTVYITALPANGTLKQLDGTNITSVPTALTDSNYQFRFVSGLHQYGSPYAYFSFYVDDGTGNSNSLTSVINATINVTFVNYPPVAISTTVSIPQESNATTLTVSTSDIETPLATVAIIITLPPASAGVLTDMSGIPIAIGATVATPWQLKFTPTPHYVGTVSFQFLANDGTQNSTGSGVLTIIVTRVNLPPSSQVYLGTAVRSVSFPITLVASDPNIGDVLTITIVSYGGLGVFSFPDSKRGLFPVATPFNLSYTLTVPQSTTVSTILNYVAPPTASGTNYANFSYFVTDQTGLSSAVTSTAVNIAANNPPTVTPMSTINVTQDSLSSPFILSGTDIDVADVLSLSVILLSLPTKGTLFFANGTAITSAPLTLSVTSAVSLQYLTNQRGSDQFSFTVQDLLLARAIAVIVSISITNVNHPPIALWLGACIGNEDTAITISQMGAYDQDPDDTVFTYYVDIPPAVGKLTQANGSSCASYPCLVTSPLNTMIYTPAKDGNGDPYATISFYAVDSHGNRSIASVVGNITVNPVNDPPVAYPSVASGYENSNFTVSLNITDVDTPVSSLYVVILSLPPPSLGYLTNQTGAVLKVGDVVILQNLTFVPVIYANGNANFSFQAYDGQSYSSPSVCAIIVISVTQPPTAGISRPSPIIVSKGSTTSFNLLAIDPDQGETYTFQVTGFQQTAGGVGSLTGPNGGVTVSTTVIGTASSTGTYTALGVTYTVSNVEESLNFTFTVNDGTYTSAPLTVVLLTSDNLPPVVNTPPGIIYAFEEKMSDPIGMNGTDPDDSRPVTVVIISLPSNGKLYVNSTPITSPGPITTGVYSATYLGNNLFYGSDSYQFAIMDAQGMLSAIQTVNISVAHVNHAPTATVGTINGVEDVPLNITQIIANDVDGDTLFVVLTGAPSPAGSFTFLNGTAITTFPVSIPSPFQFTFVPAQYANGPVTFSFYVTDGLANSTTVTATINVAAVNNPPVAQFSSISILENAAPINFTLNITDVDSPDSALVARIVSLPPASLGVVTTADGRSVSVGQFVSSPRTLTFTPAPYASGNGSISFIARDEVSFSSNSGAVNISITHVDHNPVVSAASPAVVTRGVALLIPIQAVDMDAGDVLTFTLVSVNGGGVLSTTAGGVALSPNAIIGSGTVTSSGAAVLASLYYSVPVNASGNNYGDFTFIATDQSGSPSAPFTVTFSIAHNNPPTANPASLNATQDQTSSPVTLSGNDIDVADQGSLKIYITALPTKGYLSQGSTNITGVQTLVTGPITYTTQERGSDSFSFQVVDNVGGMSPVMIVPISITSINHPPVLVNSATNLSVKENSVLVLSQISAYDIDGDVVTVYVGSLPTRGYLTQFDGTRITAANTAITDSQNRIIYVPQVDITNQTTSFTLYASDNSGYPNSNTSAVTVPIFIEHVNRPPVAYNSVLALDSSASSGTLNPNVTDPDSSVNSLTITIRSLPLASVGKLILYGVDVVQNDVIPYPFSGFVFEAHGYGYTTFTFSASDGIDTSSTFAVYGVGRKSPNNSPPEASASSNLLAQRGVPLSIALGAHDSDVFETFTYAVTVQSAGGVFASGNTVLTPPSFNLAMTQDPVNYYTNAILSFTAPVVATGSNYLQLSFVVYDSNNSASNTFSVTVGIAPNHLPVATPPPTISYLEDGNSTTFSLGGTDADPADANSLTVTITALPTKGTLYLVGGGPITTTGGSYPAGSSFFIVGTPLMYGSDSFSYQVTDNVGGSSAPQQVSISITHVNHAPQAMISSLQGNMNQPVNFQVYGQDVDPGTFFTAYITQVPAQGTLSQADGTVIASASIANPVAVTSTSGSLIYTPPTDVYGSNIGTISFFVSDNSGASNSNSGIQSSNFNIAKGDFPPTAYGSTASAADGGSVSIVLNATDPQNYTLVATITQFPSSGSLYRSDGTPITPQNPTVGSDMTVVFVAASGSYGQSVSFSYQVSSPTSGLSSGTASVTTSVYRVYGAPQYSGQTTFSIPENAAANIFLTASSQAPSYSIIIVGTPSKGSLVFVNGDTLIDITGIAPYVMNNSNSENRARYIPPANVSGVDLAIITIQVQDEHGISAPVNISISVYHVNIAPYVVPTVYNVVNTTYNYTNLVTIPENECTVISWDIFDVDSPRENLSSLVSSLPFRGKLYSYLVDGSKGPLVDSQVVILRSSDGYFHIIYCPEPNKSGNNFASFSIIASDSLALSDRRYINMRVIHTNVAPSVIVTQPVWNTSLSTDTIITGVSVRDPDATVFKVKFVLSVTYDDGQGHKNAMNAGSTITLYQYDENLCNTSTANIVCVATVDKLNIFLNQITVAGQAAPGNITLHVDVDDMGLGGAKNDSKTGYGEVRVEVFPATDARRAGNNNILTAAVASAAVVGAAAAVGVYGYLRKRSPPTSTFFGLEQGLMSGGINENPLYEGGITVENTIYRAPTFGMQKLPQK